MFKNKNRRYCHKLNAEADIKSKYLPLSQTLKVFVKMKNKMRINTEDITNLKLFSLGGWGSSTTILGKEFTITPPPKKSNDPC